MTRSTLLFAVPATLPPELGRVQKYWEGLKRGESKIPFWDDLTLSSLPDLADRMMLIDVFASPQRFRFNSAGEQVRKRYGADLSGKFADEIDPSVPLEFLTAQASATIEARAPTLYSSESETGGKHASGHARLLLPMWGNGRIEMMLGAFSGLSNG